MNIGQADTRVRAITIATFAIPASILVAGAIVAWAIRSSKRDRGART